MARYLDVNTLIIFAEIPIMKVYKLTFVKNEVILCSPMEHAIGLKGEYLFEHDKGSLIYAFVKAESEIEAIAKSRNIVNEVDNKAHVN